MINLACIAYLTLLLSADLRNARWEWIFHVFYSSPWGITSLECGHVSGVVSTLSCVTVLTFYRPLPTTPFSLTNLITWAIICRIAFPHSSQFINDKALTLGGFAALGYLCHFRGADDKRQRETRHPPPASSCPTNALYSV